MPTETPSFESLKEQFAQQNRGWYQVCRALQALHPAESLAIAPEFLGAFDDACSVTPVATASAPMPMGIRG
jgi:hypothetical protein